MAAQAASPTPLADHLVRWLAVAFLVSLMGFSPFLLTHLGWAYGGGIDAGLTRFHPSTFLAFLTLLVILLRDGNPLASFIAALRQDPRIALFLAGWVLLIFQAALVQRSPITAPIDTFLIPVLGLMIVDRVDPATRRVLVLLVHAFFVANALLGLAEFLGQFRLTPYKIAGQEVVGDWRSSALFGHPLANALATGCYAIMLMLGGGKELRGILRFAVIVLMFAAMVAFGGRASLVLLVLGGALAAAWQGWRFIAGGNARLLSLSLLALASPLAVAGVGVLVEIGFFDKLIMRFLVDHGSAKARIVMLQLFDEFTWADLLFGPPTDRLAYKVWVYGLEYGIESVWVAFIFYYGILPSALFGLGLFFYLLAVGDRCDWRIWLVLLYFFIINSTFLGIGGKTTMFTQLILTLLLVMPSATPSLSRWRGPEAVWPSGAIAC